MNYIDDIRSALKEMDPESLKNLNHGDIEEIGKKFDQWEAMPIPEKLLKACSAIVYDLETVIAGCRVVQEVLKEAGPEHLSPEVYKYKMEIFSAIAQDIQVYTKMEQRYKILMAFINGQGKRSNPGR